MTMRRIGWRGVLYLLVMTGAAGLVVVWWPELSAIWRGHALTFLVAVGLMCLGQIVQARNFTAFLDGPVSPDPWRLSGVWALSALANYAGPFQPGVAVRVLYLRRQGVAVADSLLATWRQLSASVWMSMLGLGIGLLMLGTSQARIPGGMFLLGFAMVYLLRSRIAANVEVMRRPAWIAAYKVTLAKALGRSDARGLAGVAVQYLIGWMLVSWVYVRFGVEIDPGHALIIACAVYVSSMVAVVPGNLGVMEGIYMLGAHGLGISVQEGAALAFLIRGAHVASCAVLALLAGRQSAAR